MMLAVALRYRPLTPLALGLLLIERPLHSLDVWVLIGERGHQQPPEAYAVLVPGPAINGDLLRQSLTAPTEGGLAFPSHGGRRAPPSPLSRSAAYRP